MRRMAGVALAMVLASCDGRTVSEIAPQSTPTGFWPPQSSTSASTAARVDTLPVPGGGTRDAFWQYDSSTASFIATSETCDTAFPSPVLVISSFRLMRLEVTNADYATCVNAKSCAVPDADLSLDPSSQGTWDDPRRANQPVAVGRDLARAYCQQLGGDLPTIAEMSRAAMGDATEFGITPLTQQTVKCSLGQPSGSPSCADLLAATPALPTDALRSPGQLQYNTLADVGAAAWDVGPYGHQGLFGGAVEWLRVPQGEPTCSDAPIMDDEFIGSQSVPAGDVIPTFELACSSWAAAFSIDPTAAEEALAQLGCPTQRAGDPPQFYNGFRCAFPE